MFHLVGDYGLERLVRVQGLAKQLSGLGMLVSCVPEFVALNRLQDTFQPAVRVTYRFFPVGWFAEQRVLLVLDGSCFFEEACELLKQAIAKQKQRLADARGSDEREADADEPRR